jgi:hypothetical protein
VLYKVREKKERKKKRKENSQAQPKKTCHHDHYQNTAKLRVYKNALFSLAAWKPFQKISKSSNSTINLSPVPSPDSTR